MSLHVSEAVAIPHRSSVANRVEAQGERLGVLDHYGANPLAALVYFLGTELASGAAITSPDGALLSVVHAPSLAADVGCRLQRCLRAKVKHRPRLTIFLCRSHAIALPRRGWPI
jgi:hypothetical protein